MFKDPIIKTAIIVSATLHLGVAGSWLVFNGGTVHHKEETIELRYIVIESPELAVHEEVVVESTKVVENIPEETTAQEIKEEPEKEREMPTERKISPKESIPQPEPPVVEETLIREDPVVINVQTKNENEQAYLEYYNLVREKIRAQMDSRVNRRHKGTVKSVFTVKPDGHVLVVNKVISTEGSSSGKRMTEDAVRGIKMAGPFPPFPREIGSEPIMFSLDIKFVGPE